MSHRDDEEFMEKLKRCRGNTKVIEMSKIFVEIDERLEFINTLLISKQKQIIDYKKELSEISLEPTQTYFKNTTCLRSG